MKIALLALICAAVALTGCGNKSDTTASESKSANEQVIQSAEAEDVSDDQVAKAFGEKMDEQDTFDFKAENGDDCTMVIVLHGEQSISMYRDAGDTVLVNPSGTVGVKVVPYQGSSRSACAKKAAAVLDKL